MHLTDLRVTLPGFYLARINILTMIGDGVWRFRDVLVR